MDGINIRRKDHAWPLNGGNDINTLCLQAIHELMKDEASRKKLSPRDIRALKQITTGGHNNSRSNANVERFMQHLTSCLTKCDDTQYRNVKDHLPAIAFAHNTAFNSAINCTPFEAGHGLRARTITETRASPRLQITAEEDTGLQEPDHKWESTIFNKICKLAERLA